MENLVVEILFGGFLLLMLIGAPITVALAGALMEAAGISKRLVDIAETLAGPITGGLGAATVIACLLCSVRSPARARPPPLPSAC